MSDFAIDPPDTNSRNNENTVLVSLISLPRYCTMFGCFSCLSSSTCVVSRCTVAVAKVSIKCADSVVSHLLLQGSYLHC